MIQYTLKCNNGHSFDSWFQSAGAFDKLSAAGMVSCAVCASDKVEKAIMTPRVRPARKSVQAPDETQHRPLSKPANPAEQVIVEMRRKIEESSDYVGVNFASEARAMHEGDVPQRSIYGEARLEEAKQLIEDGVPVAPLPFRPNRKTN